MEVVITVTDAADSATSVAFAKMLTASLSYRRIDSETLTSTQPQAILNLSSKEASGSDYVKDLTKISAEAQIHVDIQSFTNTESPTESFDFIVPQADAVIDESLASAVKETLDRYSDSTISKVPYNNLYPSTYAALVMRIPTIAIMVSADSVDLYRAAADDLAEIVENYEQ